MVAQSIGGGGGDGRLRTSPVASRNVWPAERPRLNRSGAVAAPAAAAASAVSGAVDERSAEPAGNQAAARLHGRFDRRAPIGGMAMSGWDVGGGGSAVSGNGRISRGIGGHGQCRGGRGRQYSLGLNPSGFGGAVDGNVNGYRSRPRSDRRGGDHQSRWAAAAAMAGPTSQRRDRRLSPACRACLIGGNGGSGGDGAMAVACHGMTEALVATMTGAIGGSSSRSPSAAAGGNGGAAASATGATGSGDSKVSASGCRNGWRVRRWRRRRVAVSTCRATGGTVTTAAVQVARHSGAVHRRGRGQWRRHRSASAPAVVSAGQRRRGLRRRGQQRWRGGAPVAA